VFLEILAVKFSTVIFHSGRKFHLIFGRKNPVEKKDAIFYLLFPRNLDKIPAKIPAVMLIKMQESNIFYGRKFCRNFGRNHCFFCTEESTPRVKNPPRFRSFGILKTALKDILTS
jgi:hypothetical protein